MKRPGSNNTFTAGYWEDSLLPAFSLFSINCVINHKFVTLRGNVKGIKPDNVEKFIVTLNSPPKRWGGIKKFLHFLISSSIKLYFIYFNKFRLFSFISFLVYNLLTFSIFLNLNAL